MKLYSCVSNAALMQWQSSTTVWVHAHSLLLHAVQYVPGRRIIEMVSGVSDSYSYISEKNFPPKSHTLWKDLAHRKLWKPRRIIFTCSACCGSPPGPCGATHLAETTFRTLWNLTPHFADKPKRAILPRSALCGDHVQHFVETMLFRRDQPPHFAQQLVEPTFYICFRLWGETQYGNPNTLRCCHVKDTLTSFTICLS